MRSPIYLGDGLYAEDQGYQIRLYASNGLTTTNEVFLDQSMLQKLNNWIDMPQRYHVRSEEDELGEGSRGLNR